MALETAENPSRFLSTIQVVMTLVSTLAGAFGGATVAKSIETALAGIPSLTSTAGPISVGIVVVATTFVSVVLGELVPKHLALARPEAIAAGVIGPIRWIALVFTPVARLLSAVTELIVSLFGAKGQRDPGVTEEEVRVLIAQGAEEGVFEDREREMVEGVLSLGDRRVTSLMIPRTEVVSLDLGDGLEAARNMLLENSRYAYLPAVDGDLDRVVGMIPVKETLAAIATGDFTDPRDFLVPPVLVPESLSALKALTALKAGRSKTALIVDEYGGVAGLVSLSDLLESVVGDLPLSGDDGEPEITRREDGSYLVDGSLSIDRFIQELSLDPTQIEGDYDTVAGLVLDRMGTIPRAGDTCRWDGCVLEVVDMDGNRIDKVLVTLQPED
ncbi:MAG: hemolysin family protein, partial [Spirochaetaceae bacterium]|nr:hemolysin family protein [Spirochaetaceae bacterium]